MVTWRGWLVATGRPVASAEDEGVEWVLLLGAVIERAWRDATGNVYPCAATQKRAVQLEACAFSWRFGMNLENQRRKMPDDLVVEAARAEVEDRGAAAYLRFMEEAAEPGEGVDWLAVYEITYKAIGDVVR